ncbi:MAG: hypothetical protein IH935_05190 [Acidobacteria bacterium]|nr:hypothetical protein [Acidobacteriota bacterium]
MQQWSAGVGTASARKPSRCMKLCEQWRIVILWAELRTLRRRKFPAETTAGTATGTI